jgi:hypothetical protein
MVEYSIRYLAESYATKTEFPTFDSHQRFIDP